MPKSIPLEEMTIEQLDVAFAAAEEEETDARTRKREIGAARQRLLLRSRASTTLDALDPAERAALLEELQRDGSSVVAMPNVVTMTAKGVR